MSAKRLTKVEQLERDVQALNKEREFLSNELAKANRHARSAVRGDLNTEAIMRRIENAVAGNRPSFKPLPTSRARVDRTAQEMVLLLSDLHASEVVRPEAVEGLNAYDWKIMLDRLSEVTKGMLSHAGHFGFKIGKIRVPMLGDMLSGDIHEELAITNDRPTAEAVVDLSYEIHAWAANLLQAFGESGLLFVRPGDVVLEIDAVPGNHPRRSQKPSFKQYHNNSDWLFYQMLRALFEHVPQVQVNAPRAAYSTIQIAERWQALLMHGDGIRTTMPGVPWGGVSRRISQLESQMTKARRPLDFVFMGHWHSPQSLAGIHARTWLNGSVKGIDEYALQRFGQGHGAEQTLLTFHKKRGWTGTYALDLQAVQPASEGW